MKKRWFLCLALALILLLTACGGESGARQSQADSLLGTAANVAEEEILLTVDGREVPAWRYLYWLARVCDSIAADYQAAGVQLDWETTTGETTLREYARAQALSDTLLYATVENWAAQYDCVPQETTVTEPAAEWGLNQEQMTELETVGRLYRSLYDLFCAEGSVLSPTEEALSDFAEDGGWVGMERLLFADADRAIARERAAAAFSQLNNAAEPAAEFAALAAAGDDPVGQRTFCLGDGTVDAALEAALLTLEVGQYSGILESEEGFSLLRRTEPDRQTLLELYFDARLQQSASSAEVRYTEVYQQLDVVRFYETLEKQRLP